MEDLGDPPIDRSLLDEIGPWTEMKHDIVSEYARAYSAVMSNSRSLAPFHHYYIDGFASAGHSVRRGTGEILRGSALRSLEVQPPFDHHHFVELDPRRATELRKHSLGHPVTVIEGDANVVLPRIFSETRYQNYERAFCLLDPYSEDALAWETIVAAARAKTIDLLLHFPTMAINRNCLPKNGMPTEDAAERLTRFWGDDSWRRTAYEDDGLFQGTLFEGGIPFKQPNEVILDAFRKRLVENAGFAGASLPIPMKNGKGNTVYHLIFAAHNGTALRIMQGVAKKYAKVHQPYAVRPLTSARTAS